MPALKSSKRLDAQRNVPPRWRAARATRSSSGQTEALAPKAPPTSGQMTRTCARARPSTPATSACARDGLWLPSQSVSRACCASQRARQARGSRATANTRGSCNLACTLSCMGRLGWLGWFGSGLPCAVRATGLAWAGAAKSSSGVSACTSRPTSAAAWQANAWLRAITMAMGWPT